MSSHIQPALNEDVKRSTADTSADSAEAVLEGLEGQYFITDVCANLTNKKFARDVDSVIQRAQNAGVKKIIVCGNNIQSSKEALRLTRLYPNYIYCAAGVHPNEQNHVISEIMEKQLELASELKMPLMIYEKEANSDVIQILRNNITKLPQIVVHSFSGKTDELQAYLSLDCYICLTAYYYGSVKENRVPAAIRDHFVDDRSKFINPEEVAEKLVEYENIREEFKKAMAEAIEQEEERQKLAEEQDKQDMEAAEAAELAAEITAVELAAKEAIKKELAAKKASQRIRMWK
ncbi:3'-5' ssDNA/RNA exonuclease TatD-like [Stegodyphus dumicola]|uniref:3'-5' ssDNA/RNA exonuclease TatD-like n=1 Tax=Stegodyphus dumicola TaxID=202533 RepID=UPI0015B1DE9B|nr:3'-5' ssDNA/RNA exonuclease TatD-like [Stegodyphus dumicola]